MSYKTILFEFKDRVAWVSFNRPEIHNAFNDTMIQEFLDVFDKILKDKNIRVVVLTGKGKSFCAGADLNWMRRVKDYTYEENFKESLNLAELFYKIYSIPKPVIGRINGAAIGGGTGFVAVSDIAIASMSAKFSFSEVRIGVVPACISPYVVRKIGEGRARELFLTGERISAEKALKSGLVNGIAEPEDLDKRIEEILENMLKCGPNALATCKELLRNVPGMGFESVKKYTAEVIAKLRLSEEGQEGMSAFLEKRPPKWVE